MTQETRPAFYTRHDEQGEPSRVRITQEHALETLPLLMDGKRARDIVRIGQMIVCRFRDDETTNRYHIYEGTQGRRLDVSDLYGLFTCESASPWVHAFLYEKICTLAERFDRAYTWSDFDSLTLTERRVLKENIVSMAEDAIEQKAPRVFQSAYYNGNEDPTYTCAVCEQAFYSEDDLEDVPGYGNLCSDCEDTIPTCYNCDMRDDIYTYRVDGEDRLLCERCSDNLTTCDNCGKQSFYDDDFQVAGDCELLCDTCYAEYRLEEEEEEREAQERELCDPRAIAKRVQTGIAFLEEHYPTQENAGRPWYTKIRLERLDIASSYNCILGQLFGNYGDADEHLPIRWNGMGTQMGFCPDGDEHEALNTAWVVAITLLLQQYATLVCDINQRP